MNTTPVQIEALVNTPEGMKMSHIEIANVASKRSDSVKRTIERLAKEGGIKAPQIVERHSQYGRGAASTNIHLLLDRLDSITVMATVQPTFCAVLVQRWDELESGKVVPLAQQSTSLVTVHEKMSTAMTALDMARAYGFTGNQAVLSADKATQSLIQFSPLAAMGQTSLVAVTKELTFTPTQIGQMMMPAISAREVNQRIRAAGLQEKIDDQWVPTERGKAFCEVLDTGKSRSSGTPVKQVK